MASERRQRRPLEGGTLLPDFLGRSNLLARTRRLERQSADAATSALSLAAAEGGYVRRRGALFMGGWGQANVSQSQTNVTLQRYGASVHAPLILPFAGSITSLMVSTTAARTNGSLTVTVYVAGAATALAATIDDVNTLTVEERAQVGEYTYEAGEQVTLRITTTSNWTPTSADVLVAIEVAGG